MHLVKRTDAVNWLLAQPYHLPGRHMDLFTPSPKPRKRPAQAPDAGRRTKAKTPQSTRAEPLASNSRPRASREPTDSTRRKQQNAKAGPSKLGKQADHAPTPPIRQSTRVSRPTLKKAAATEIVLSSDEDSDLPSPSAIVFKKIPKAPPRPNKRKRASSPLKTTKKTPKVICLEISDSDDDERVEARPVKRPKVASNTAAPEDVINLCSSSEVDEPPQSSPLAQAQKRKSSPEMDVRSVGAADPEVRKSKRPSRERNVPTPKVAGTQPKVDPPNQASHFPGPPSPPPPPPISSPPPQRPAPLPTRIRSIRMFRTKSMLSGRKFTRPEREGEITYFEPDAQPQLTLLTHTLFKKSIASVKAKIEVQKRKKKKAAASAIASSSASTSKSALRLIPAPAPAPRIDDRVSDEPLQKAPSSVTNARLSLPEPPDDPPGVFIEKTKAETVAFPLELIESSPATGNEDKTDSILKEASGPDPIEPVPTNKDVPEPEAEIILKEIPDIKDLIASAKHVTTVLDRLKALKTRNCFIGDFPSPSKQAPAESSQSLPLNITTVSSTANETEPEPVASPSTPGLRPAKLYPLRDPTPTLRRSSSMSAGEGARGSTEVINDERIGPPQQSESDAATPSLVLKSIVPNQGNSTTSRKPLPSRSPPLMLVGEGARGSAETINDERIGAPQQSGSDTSTPSLVLKSTVPNQGNSTTSRKPLPSRSPPLVLAGEGARGSTKFVNDERISTPQQSESDASTPSLLLESTMPNQGNSTTSRKPLPSRSPAALSKSPDTLADALPPKHQSLPSSLEDEVQVEARASSSTDLNSNFPVLDLNLGLEILSHLPDIDEDEDLSLSDLELVYPEDVEA